MEARSEKKWKKKMKKIENIEDETKNESKKKMAEKNK